MGFESINQESDSGSSSSNAIETKKDAEIKILKTINNFAEDETEDFFNNKDNVDVSTLDFRSLIVTAVVENKTQAYENIVAYITKRAAELGLDINQIKRSIASSSGKNLLHFAANAGNFDLCAELLVTDSGINPFLRDYDKFTPADYAYQNLTDAMDAHQQAVVDHQNVTNEKNLDPNRATRLRELSLRINQLEEYIHNAQRVVQLFIDNQCALDVTWLALPNEIHLVNKLVVGHPVRRIDVTGGHIYSVKSLKKQAENLNDVDKSLMKFRILQFKQVAARPEQVAIKPEIEIVSKYLTPFLSTSALRNASVQHKHLEFCDPAKNIFSADGNVHVIPMFDEQDDIVRINFKQFKSQLKILEDALEEEIEKFKNGITEQETFVASSVNKLTSRVYGAAGGTVIGTGVVTLAYNVVLGVVSGIAAIPTYGQCLDYLQANNTHGNPYNTTTCLDRAPAPPPSFDQQAWDNVETAATWPNVAFASIISIALLSAATYKAAITLIEKISKSREQNRQEHVLDEAKTAAEELIVTLKKQFPKMTALLDRLENPQIATKETALNDLTALKEQLSAQREQLLKQGASLQYFPSLGVFKQPPADAAAKKLSVGAALGIEQPLVQDEHKGYGTGKRNR